MWWLGRSSDWATTIFNKHWAIVSNRQNGEPASSSPTVNSKDFTVNCLQALGPFDCLRNVLSILLLASDDGGGELMIPLPCIVRRMARSRIVVVDPGKVMLASNAEAELLLALHSTQQLASKGGPSFDDT